MMVLRFMLIQVKFVTLTQCHWKCDCGQRTVDNCSFSIDATLRGLLEFADVGEVQLETIDRAKGFTRFFYACIARAFCERAKL